MNNFKIERVRSYFLLCSIVCLTSPTSWAVPDALPDAELLPVVAGDPETRSTPFIAWFKDLTADGYIEEEYSVSGHADIYGYVDDAGASPAVEVITAATDYTTRILVRRPVDSSVLTVRSTTRC